MDRVMEIYDEEEFESLLDEAEMNAANDWEERFVADLRSKFQKFGRRMYLSESQREHLERIANDE